MKKIMIGGLILALFSIILPPAANAASLSFRLYGGGNYLAGGDLNSGLQGWADYWQAVRRNSGYTQQTGSYNPVHLGFNVGGDIVLHLSSRWGVGIGAEYLTAKKASNLTFQSSKQTLSWEYFGNPTAIPIKASVYYFVPLGDNFTVDLHIGAGYYFAKTRLESRNNGKEDGAYLIDSSAQGVGFHGGVGLEMRLSPSVNLLIEAAGRYASLAGFEGSVKIVGDGGWDGTLRYWEATTSLLASYGYIDLTGGAPSGSAIKLVRDAKIDFSGFSLRAGVVIKL